MLMRFDPFDDLDRITRRVLGDVRTNYMPADAYRKDDRFYLHVDVPGVDPESIDMTVEKNTLTISAERSFDAGDDHQVVLNERPVGTFTRQFFLGDGLDTENIEAGYDLGVLTVSIPVTQTARARKIQVGTAHEALTA